MMKRTEKNTTRLTNILIYMNKQTHKTERRRRRRQRRG